MSKQESELIRSLEGKHNSLICSVRASIDGKYVATADRSMVFIYDVDNDYACHQVTSDLSCKFLCPIAFSPDSKVIATFERRNKLSLYAISDSSSDGGENSAFTTSLIISIKDKVPGSAEAIEFSPTNTNLVGVVSHHRVHHATIYDLKTQTLKFDLDVNNLSCQCLAFHPCQDVVAIACTGVTNIFIFELNAGTKIKTVVTEHSQYIWRVKFFDEGKKIASANSEDKSIRFFDVESGNNISNIELGEHCLDFTFADNEEKIVACTRKPSEFVKPRYFSVNDGAVTELSENENEVAPFSTKFGVKTLFVDRCAVKPDILYFSGDNCLIVWRSKILGNFWFSRKILFLCRWNGNEESSFYKSMQVFNVFATTCLYVSAHAVTTAGHSSSSTCMIC